MQLWGRSSGSRASGFVMREDKDLKKQHVETWHVFKSYIACQCWNRLVSVCVETCDWQPLTGAATVLNKQLMSRVLPWCTVQ